MPCPHGAATALAEQARRTALGYRTFHCRACRRMFNERTGTPYNHLQYPTDLALLVVLWRRRYTLRRWDLAGMFLARGLVFTHEAVRDREARFAPLLNDRPRARRRGHGGTKWHAAEPYRKVDGRRCSVYRAIDREGNRVGALLGEQRDVAAAQRLFARAPDLVGHAPEQATTAGHDASPRALRETLGPAIRHRTSRHKNNRIARDHRAIKRRYDPLRGCGDVASAARFRTGVEERRRYFRAATRCGEYSSLADRRRLFRDRWAAVMAELAAA